MTLMERGDAYDAAATALARTVVDQVAKTSEPLTYGQQMDLVKDALFAFYAEASRLDAGKRYSIPVARKVITAAVRDEVLRRDGFVCLSCGATDDLQVDHVVPLSSGGPHSFDNFQTLCGSCNQSKGAAAVDYRLDARQAKG